MASIDLFGFEIKRKNKKPVTSVISVPPNDGSTVVHSAAGYYGLAVDVEGIVKNENDLIRRYRETAAYSDCDNAVDEIVNEAIVFGSNHQTIKVVLDELKISENIKKQIYQEFDTVLRLYDFSNKGHDLFRQWYIDGRMFFHVILESEENTSKGIQELRMIDPRKIRKIKRIKKEKNEKGIEVSILEEEYYLYNESGTTPQTSQTSQTTGIKLAVDSIIYCHSGLIDANTNMVLSHLHKAIKPVNQLKMMEDSLVIYRISRAPERRIFYIDVGDLPKASADQYLNNIMQKFRNKIVYDVNTGEVENNKNHLSMMEDFWIPRREGKSTEITTLPGGQNLDQIADIQYFQTKVFQSLRVPISRMQANQNFSLGRTTEITRDEIKFNKFIERLRKKFASLFMQALGIQLITKKIIRVEEWDDFVNLIRFDFQQDNHFTEMKEAEIMGSRLGTLQNIEPYVGKYFSVDWVRKNVLMQTEQEMKDIDKQLISDLTKYKQVDSDPENQQ